MPTVTSQLHEVFSSKKFRRVETTAIISSKVSTHQYLVKEAGRTILVRSAITDELKQGDSVVLASTDHGKYIVGLEAIKNRDLTTVIING